MTRDVAGMHFGVDPLLRQPGLSGLIAFLIQLESLRFDGGSPFEVGALGDGLLLILKPPELLLLLLEVLGHTLSIDAELACGLVDEVDGLVREVALGEIAAAELHRGHHGRVVDLDLVVGLIARFDGSEHLDGILHGGLFEPDGLEAPLQGGVLLDIASILIGCCGTDDLELTASEGGLHEVAGVDGALGGTGADHVVDLVDEEDDFALGLLDLVHDGLKPLLELAAELGAGDEGAHVQGEHPPAPEDVGNVLGDDALREALGDGGLADAGAADDDGVILGAPGEGLHKPADLLVAANHGVQLAIAGKCGQVDTVLLKGAVLALGTLVCDAGAATDLLESLVDLLLVDAELPEDAGGGALPLRGGGDEQVLGAYELILEAVGLTLGVFKQMHCPRRGVHLRRLIGHLGATLQDILQSPFHGVHVHAQRLHDLHGKASFQLQQGEHDMFNVPLAVTELPDKLLGGAEHLLGLLCEVVGFQHHVSPPPFPYCVSIES